MERFTSELLKRYLKEKVFVGSDYENIIDQISEENGGLSSAVFKAQTNKGNFYIKQIVEGMAANFGKLPSDLVVLFSDDRQKYESKAIEMFNDAIGKGYAPDIVYSNLDDKILVLSDAAKNGGQLFENVFENRCNEKITKSLAKIAAELASKTFGKFEFLRSKDLDAKIRQVKLKYYYKMPFERNNINRKLIGDFADASINCAQTLCHGDYHPKNVIISNNDEVALIDFEESIIHDSVWDISSMLAHYLLRVLNYPDKSDRFKELSLLLIEDFFSSLKISYKRKELDYRIKNYTAGWMALRIDGIAKARWINSEDVKEKIRQISRKFIESELSISELVKVL